MMKKLKTNTGAKLAAAALFSLLMAVLLFSAIGVSWMYDVNAYSGEELDDILNDQALNYVVRRMCDVMDSYRWGHSAEDLDTYTGMTFQIYDENDDLVYDGLGSQSYRAQTDRYGFYYPAEGMIVDDDETITTADSPVRYKMVGYVLNDIDQIHQLSSKLSLISFWYIYRYELIVTMVAAILLSIARWPDRQP
jgi:hypothetical protein